MTPSLRRVGRAGYLCVAAPALLAVLTASLWVLPASAPVGAGQSGFATPTLGSGDSVTFHGAGWGHGVGISHQSLPARAAAGQSAAEILNFYYPNTTLTGGWGMNDLRVLLATASSSRFRPRGAFDLVLDGSTVYSSSERQLFTVSRSGSGWSVSAGDNSLCPGGRCDGNVLQIRTADGVAVESSATGHSYSHGQVTLTKLSGGSWYRIVLTNLELEDYLGGVSEVHATWPAAALRAQAVASRTYAIHIARERRASNTWTAPFDLYSSTRNQVYDGNTREQSDRNGPWLRAIADTAGQVLLYGGQAALTLFTTSGGGYTEASGYAFSEQHPYLVAAPDPYTAGDPYTPWARTYGVGQLSRWLGRFTDTGVGTLRRISVTGNISASGRVDRATVTLEGTAGTKSVSGQRFVYVANTGAAADGLVPLADASGRGGHLLSTKFVFGEPGSLPPSLDNAAVVVSVQPPGTPQAFSVTPGAAEIHVSWDPPSAGGPVTDYLITWISSTGASGTIRTTETSRVLRNLSPGSTYTIQLVATNGGGTSPAEALIAAPLGVPRAPSDVSVGRGDGVLQVSWSPPADNGGAAVEAYTLYWQAPDGVVQSETVIGTAHTIAGLSNGVAYTVSVRATNQIGASEPSAAVSRRPGAPPGAPQNLAVTRGDGRIDVTWDPPAGDGGLGVSGYEITWVSSTGATGSIRTSDTAHTLGNLRNGATYTITAVALNEAGASAPGEAATGSPAAAPGPPTEVTADRGDGRITVNWQPPADDGGVAVTGYTVAWVAPDGSGGSVDTAAGSHTIEGLSNGTTYTLTVTAGNEVGASAPGTPASATPAYIPGAPSAPVTERGDGWIHVTWQPPVDDGGVAVTGYTVSWVAPDGSGASADTAANGFTIEGLSNGATYGITVTATNEIGTSTAADPVRATPGRVPGPLAYAEIGLEPDALVVSWQPPADDGGLAVRSYTLAWVGPDGNTTSIDTSDTSHRIEGLTGGTPYLVTILANNEMGASVTPVRAQATPLVGPVPSAATEGAAAAPSPPPVAAEEAGASAAPAVRSEPASAPASARSARSASARSARSGSPAWQDYVTDNTAVFVLAAVGLVLIAALMYVTRRQRAPAPAPARDRRTVLYDGIDDDFAPEDA